MNSTKTREKKREFCQDERNKNKRERQDERRERKTENIFVHNKKRERD